MDEEVVGRAVALLQSGKLAEADAILRAFVEENPKHAPALHFLGLTSHERGRTDEAIALIERALKLAPSDLDARNNLGNLYIFANRLEEAEATFRAVLAASPHFASTRFNLGVLYARSKRFNEAIVELELASVSEPTDVVYSELGDALRASARFEDAALAYEKAFAITPTDEALRKRLCRAYFLLADAIDRQLISPVNATKHLERWIELEPNDPIAKHTLAAYSGRDVPPRCSDGYVKETFDLFADSFDNVLETISYTGVRASAEALEIALRAPGRTPPSELVVLDAGCGTGALAPVIEASCARLIGIDLSPKMLAKARERGIYDRLAEAEVVDYLSHHPAEHHAIVAADIVNYFGDIAPLARAAANALQPAGYFILTLELLETDDPEATYRLDQHGRYSHAERYVVLMLESAGFTVERTNRFVIRIEYGAPVQAAIITAVLTAAPTTSSRRS